MAAVARLRTPQPRQFALGSPTRARCRSPRCKTAASTAQGLGTSVLAALLLYLGRVPDAPALGSNEVLQAWFAAQSQVQTWSADFVQTRALKSLTQPLTARGRAWFAEPNRFRWELGNPPQTIAVRQGEQVTVIYPLLNRAERYTSGAGSAGPWREAITLMEAGFSRSLAEKESRFQILSLREINDCYELTLQPKASAARRMIPQIKLACGTNDFALRASELRFADGSVLRNEFANAKFNPKLDDALFSPTLGPDVKIVEPLGKSGL